MNIEIITPDKNLYEGEVTFASFPGTDGSFGVMNNHAPLITTLRPGTIKVVEGDNNEVIFDVKGGVVEVMKNKIIVLAE